MSNNESNSKLSEKQVKALVAEQAFPGRKSTMGYVTGLTKLEYMSLQLLANGNTNIKDSISYSKALIAACAEEVS
jgi:hypothetical protein